MPKCRVTSSWGGADTGLRDTERKDDWVGDSRPNRTEEVELEQGLKGQKGWDKWSFKKVAFQFLRKSRRRGRASGEHGTAQFGRSMQGV